MREIAQKGASKSVYELRFNPADYSHDEFYAPLNVFQKVISYRDDISPVSIDMARLMTCFRGLRARDFQYYFFMLNLLERNDKAVVCPHREMREVFKDRLIHTVSQAVDRLVKAGLIFRAPNTRGKYIINPVYAWKGNRLDYLDLSSFEDRTGL